MGNVDDVRLRLWIAVRLLLLLLLLLLFLLLVPRILLTSLPVDVVVTVEVLGLPVILVLVGTKVVVVE